MSRSLDEGCTSMVTPSTGINNPGLVGKRGAVLVYDRKTGASLGQFVTTKSGGLDDPIFMCLSRTNPTTLRFQ